MSRGPGKIERAIEAAFAASPKATFNVVDLMPIAYPNVYLYRYAHPLMRPVGIEKKHRVAILRAAKAAAKRAHWEWHVSSHPGGDILFYNPLDIDSYALGQERAGQLGTWWTVEKIVERMQDIPYTTYKAVGGSWWKRVELNKALHAGDTERAAMLQKQIDAEMAQMARSLRSLAD